jgi:hypothetical protein
MPFGFFSTKQDKSGNISPLKLKIFGVIVAIMIVCAVGLALFGKSNSNSNQNSTPNNINALLNSPVVSNATGLGGAINASQALSGANANTAANANTNSQATVAAKTIESSAIALVTKQTGHCKALAPQDWSFVSNEQATGADLFSPDKSLHAGWGIAAVYTYMYPTAEDFLTAWLGYAFSGSFTDGGISFGEAKPQSYDFIERDFTTSVGRKGTALYKTYNFGDPTSYVVSVYMADATNDIWAQQGATPSYVAVSIRCVSQLRPTTSSVDLPGSDPSKDSDNPEVSLSDKWTEAIMGYENVYSPTTGEHYEAPLNAKWDGGPDGSGYYRSLPNGGYEKLESGFGDY